MQGATTQDRRSRRPVSSETQARVRAWAEPLPYSRSVAASLSTAERRILEAAHDALAEGLPAAELTDAVRRMLGQLPGPEFRLGVAQLKERGLLRARVTTKVNGEVGRVLIEQITPLGRSAIRKARRHPSVLPSQG